MPTSKPTRSPKSRERELLQLVEHLRYRLAEIDAYASAADDMLRQIPWTIPRQHRRNLNRLSHLLGDAAESASAAIDETDHRLSAVMKRGRREGRRKVSGA